MLLALAATLAIVVQDHASLRASPRSGATELAAFWQGDVVEIRGERADYVKVYNYRRERGGYLKRDTMRQVGLTEADAPPLLAVMRFLRDTPGSEALGISYGAAYLKAAPAKDLTAEPFDAIGRMAERLADAASGTPSRLTDLSARLEVVREFGVQMRSFERNGRMQVCYDGEMFRRVLALPSATPEERAHAALGLTRPDCIDPGIGPVMRSSLDAERRELLERIDEQALGAMTRSRVRARRAGVWASYAYEQARHSIAPTSAAERALAELTGVEVNDLGEDRRNEYSDAVLRVSAVRWATGLATIKQGPLTLTVTPGEPGQTCITLRDNRGPRVPPPVRRCTYGIVWTASAQPIAQGSALALAVQPLESWRELWVFQKKAGAWTIDVLSPAANDPEQGYVELAGFVPGVKHLLIVREFREGSRYRRRFEEVRLSDFALVRQASAPELLRNFGRWQDIRWRRDTLALRLR